MWRSFRLSAKRTFARAFGRRNFVRAVFWIYLTTLVVFAIIGDRGLFKSYRLWSECRRLNQEIFVLKQDVIRLQGQVHRFRNDERTLEKYAREELHLAGENEIHYIFR